MRILSIKTFHGPGVYHHKPTLLMIIDLEQYTEKASTDFPDFNERLLNLLPELNEHHCSPGYKGGFKERLERGTYVAHIIEHVTLALSEICGIGVNFGKAVYGGSPGIYHVVVRYKCEEGMRYLLKSAVEFVDSVIKNENFSLDQSISEAKKIISKEKLGPSTDAIIKAAEMRNIPCRRVDDQSFFQLGYGKYRKLIQATTTSLTGDIAVSLAQDKNLTKMFLAESSIRVPRGFVVTNEEELLDAFHDLQGMVAVKPSNGNHGRGVSLKLKTPEDVFSAFRIARTYSDNIIVEEFFEGKDFRVLVVNGKMIAASYRVPAFVIGDGKRSIQELIDLENQNPMRGEGHEKPLTFITVDEEAEFFLKKEHIDLYDTPPPGKIVYLRETANLSTGGTANDVTDSVHPEIQLMCERAARIVGLDVCGIDLILEDIAVSPRNQRGGIIEVNAGPGIRMHLYPSEGAVRDVGGAIVENLFSEKKDGRIPIIAITGTNGKTTVTRLISHVLQEVGMVTGTTTTDGIYLGKSMIAEGDTTGPASARTILSDPSVEVAVLETARGGIIRRGLGYDWSDVGIITNIQPDHIGQDGIESLEDIMWVKSLVVERVKKDGTIILNADSKELRAFIEKRSDLLEEGRKLVLFSMNDHLEAIDLLKGKGSLFYHKDGLIFQYSHGSAKPLVSVMELPLTMAGTSHFQIENVLASFAALSAMNVSEEDIIKAMKTFHNNDNPGRLNLYRVKNGFLLLDYGHNPDAFLSVGMMVKKWGCKKVSAVIGAPGDRSDSMIRFAGTAAAQVFDRIIIREDEDKRGRKEGEVAKLLFDSIMNEKRVTEVCIAHDSLDALHEGIRHMQDHEVMIYFYENREIVLEELNKFGAGPVDLIGMSGVELNL